MNINQAHCLHTGWLMSTHSEILGDELRWLKPRWSFPSTVKDYFFHLVGLPDLADGLKLSGQLYDAKLSWNVIIMLYASWKVWKTKGKWRALLKALCASLEPDNVSSQAFTHTIAFPQGTPTQLATDRPIIALTLACTVSEWSYMIGLLSVTDGLG